MLEAWLAPSTFEYGEWPLTALWQPLAGAAAYLTIIGLLQRHMAGRAAVTGSVLHGVVLAHNVALAVGSLLMLCGTVHAVAAVALHSGEAVWSGRVLLELFCDPRRVHNRGPIAFWTYCFYVSKYYEFIDTVIIVLKKRELRFLHVYHHVLTLVVVYLGMAGQGTYTWIAVVLNTFVHTIMYYYYYLALRGYKPWWKSWLTVMQMIQFWINMAGLVAWAVLRLVYAQPCAGDWLSWSTCFFINATFYALFQLFFNKSYGGGKGAKGKGKEKAM